jgi:hypothetical protein
MLRQLHCDGYAIEFDENFWRMDRDRDMRTTTTLGYSFEAIRGDHQVHYKESFARNQDLPFGEGLGLRHIRAVLVGWHAASGRWLLGLHIARNEEDKPVFRTLAQWSEAEKGEEAKQAARALAVLLGVSLNVYGEKKDPTPTREAQRSGVTGPLEPHLRQKIDLAKIAAYITNLELPILGDGYSLSRSPNGLILKLGKHSGKGKIEMPVFQMCEFSNKSKSVKLIPPTGLLTSFMRDRSREIVFDKIANVEHRIIHTSVSQAVKAGDKTEQEELTHLHLWGVYLTLPDESLLLLQASYAESAKLRKSKMELVGSAKLETNSAEGLKYFREHLQEKEMMEQFALQTEQIAYSLAYAVGKHLVRTEVEG